MNLENYVNLSIWVQELNSGIQEILLERLRDAIIAWVSAFNSESLANGTQRSRKMGSSHNRDESSKTKSITLEPILHELTIRNQVIFLEPPLEHARSICFSSLHSCLGTP
jgi:dynein heavy chain 1, cytosolic